MSNMKIKSKNDTENLLERIVDKRNFFQVCKKVVTNMASSGIDGMKVEVHIWHLNIKIYSNGYKQVVDNDLEKLFDNVNHVLLMHIVSQKIEDKRALKLIRKYLSSEIMLKGTVAKSEEGVPQGCSLSPLLRKYYQMN